MIYAVIVTSVPFAQAHLEGVHVITVPVGRNFINMDELEAMASEPKAANVIGIDRISQLATIIDNITMAICDGGWRWAIIGDTTQFNFSRSP